MKGVSMLPSNCTPEETYRLTGTLTPEQIEGFLDSPLTKERADNAKCYISEAMGQYPSEDFLSSAIRRLEALSKRLKGYNQEEVKSLALKLEEIQYSTYTASEYGRSELDNATRELSFQTKKVPQ